MEKINNRVLGLVEELSVRLGIKNIEFEQLANSRFDLPTILFKGNYQIWVDNNYLAYSNTEEKFVHYVFVNWTHIQEELKDIPVLIRTEKDQKHREMLRNILGQLKKARKEMVLKHKSFYMAEGYGQVVIGFIDSN